MGGPLENNLMKAAILTLISVLGALYAWPLLSFPAALLLVTVLPGCKLYGGWACMPVGAKLARLF